MEVKKVKKYDYDMGHIFTHNNFEEECESQGCVQYHSNRGHMRINNNLEEECES